jgi:NADH-quinone oxidoreductase subunit G
MAKLVNLTIDGVRVQVPEGTLLVDAAKLAGIDIPVFCYHPKMEPVGMCRMCLVEIGRPVIDRATGQPLLEADDQLPGSYKPKIQFGAKLETACTTPVSEGMVVLGTTKKVKDGREDILEFLLTSHPLDCPVCDKGGECPLQNLTMGFGPGQSRFVFDEKKRLAKRVQLGELIYLDRERCIQCARCIRFQDRIVDEPVIGFSNRGRDLEIISFSDPGFDSYWSGNTTDICPVGALTTTDFRFRARPWELKAAASICNHCPVGCNLTLNVRREAITPSGIAPSIERRQPTGYASPSDYSQPQEYIQPSEYSPNGKWVVKRLMPRQNETVNEIWICDKGRFGYHFAEESPDRLASPLVRKGGVLEAVTWEEAVSLVAERLGAAGGGLLTLAGGRLANEDLYNLRKFTGSLGGKTALYTNMGGGELTSSFGFSPGTNIASLGKGSAILVVGSDLEEEAPIWWLRVKQAAARGASLIVLNPRNTRLDRSATFSIRFPYGSGVGAILAMVSAIASRPDFAAGQYPVPQPSELPPSARGLARLAELRLAANLFSKAQDAIVLFGSEGMGLVETGALALACANLLRITGHFGRPNNGLLGVWPGANDQGAWEMGWKPFTDLPAALSEAEILYIVAADPVGDDSTFQNVFGGQKFVIVQDLYLSQTARLADVVLPAQSWIEREGSYTSGERRVQRFYPAVRAVTLTPQRTESPGVRRALVLTAMRPDLEGPQADYAIPALIAERMGIEGLTGHNAAAVFARLAEDNRAFDGLSYPKLAEVNKQWPIIGRNDLYFGGAAYENTQGLGVQLPLLESEPDSLSQPPVMDFKLPRLGLMAFPVTRLYDRGATLMPSSLLHRRIGEPYIVLNVLDGKRLKLERRSMVRVSFPALDQSVVTQIHLDEELPERVVLVPRSFGIPVNSPTPVEIRPV